MLELEIDTPETETKTPAPERRELPELGIHENMPGKEVGRAPGISKSGLDKIRKCPARYIFEKQNPRPPTPALVFGNALHCLVLEPEEFEQRYIADEYAGSQSKMAKTWREATKERGLITINTKTDADKGEWGLSDWDSLHRMAASVRANPAAAALLDEARTELAMFWIDEGTRKLCKGIVDAYSDAHRLLIDLKSSADASYSGFQRSIHDYRYDVQDAFYQDGARACGLRVDGFVFIAVEKEPPHMTACYVLSPEWRRQGRVKYQHDMEVYKQCMESNEWPAYEPMRDLEMPNFAKYIKIS